MEFIQHVFCMQKQNKYQYVWVISDSVTCTIANSYKWALKQQKKKTERKLVLWQHAVYCFSLSAAVFFSFWINIFECKKWWQRFYLSLNQNKQ